MLTPALRQDLKLYPGTAMEDGSPSWLLYDQLRNKYFTLGISAFRMVKNWIDIHVKVARCRIGATGNGFGIAHRAFVPANGTQFHIACDVQRAVHISIDGRRARLRPVDEILLVSIPAI